MGIKLCKKHKEANGASDNDPPLIGAFVPSCKVNGDYEEIQCHGSTGFCWCVDKFGNEMEGTRTRREPNCTHPGKKGYENVTNNENSCSFARRSDCLSLLNFSNIPLSEFSSS